MTRSSFDRRLIAPMVLGSVLNPVNSSILAVSLIPIGRDFGSPPSHTAWLISALYIATAVGQPVVGRLVDTYGPRPLYLIGTAVVGVAGVLGMLAPDLPTLVGARVLLGFGTCAGYPASMFLIRREAERTGEQSPAGVLTVLSVANQTVSVLGPPLGGLLIGVAGWRSTLAVNVPLSVACLVLGARRLPSYPRPIGTRSSFDLPGIALFTGGLVAGLLFLFQPAVDHWWLAALAVAALAGFTVVELDRDEPFVDLRLLAGHHALVATYTRNLLTAVVSYGFIFGFTQWLEDGRGLSASHAGLTLLPMFVAAIAVSTATGRRPELRAKLMVGSIVQLAVCLGLHLVGAATPIVLLLVLTLALGVPQGLLNLANQNALYHQADPARLGSSAGLLRTSMYLGAIVASAANGVFLHQRADTSGLHAMAWFLAVVAVLALLLAALDRSLGFATGSDDANRSPNVRMPS